ncbi:MAG: hypothetical protein IKM82_01120 [Oscillospiraceae bacterium]|nr:hypothetical protein [Oscillospiraceae bacterium]
MESWLSRLEALYNDYIGIVRELERNRKFGDGLFGIRPGPANDPCHDRFAADAEKLLKEFGDTSPTSEECAALLRYLFTAPEAWRELTCAYWMLIAVQGYGIDLIGYLEPADAKALAEILSAAYPRYIRLPVQEKLLKRLKQQAN